MDFRRPIEALIPDAQGRILGVLARTTEELNLTTLADLSGVSLAHAARVVPRLAGLGVVERRDVPPAILVRLARTHLAARLVIALSELRGTFLEELHVSTKMIEPAPVNVTLFGSFARGDDDAASDVDVVVVRPDLVDDDDRTWSDSIKRWESHVRELSGNTVNRIEVAERDAGRLARSRRPLWRSIHSEGVVLFGLPLREIGGAARAE